MEGQPADAGPEQALLRREPGGIRRLANLLTRYGGPIEYDLLTIGNGVRLAVEWKRRRYRFLLNFIDQLPEHSRYAAAVAQDDELAAALLHMPRPAPKGRRLSEWTPTVRELRSIADRLGIAVQYLSRGQYQPAQLEEPETTAMQRLQVHVDWQTHIRITAQLLPGTAEEA